MKPPCSNCSLSKEITEAELEEARDKVSWGRERRSLAINERGRRITAVHEAGHAICLLKTPHSGSFTGSRSVPREPGITMWLPSDEKTAPSSGPRCSTSSLWLMGRPLR